MQGMRMTHLETTEAATTLEWGIIAHSLTLPERAHLYNCCPDAFASDPARAAAFETRWREVLARPAEVSLEDRCADYQINAADLPAIVGDVSEEASEHLPRQVWMDVCAEVLQWRGPLDETGLPEAPYLERKDGEEPMPFEHALVPWVDVATRRLLETSPQAKATFSADMLRNEQRRLLENLSWCARFAHIDDLTQRRLGMYSGNDFAVGMFLSKPPRQAYIATIQSMIGAHASEWMRRRAAMARLLGVRVVAWARCLAEFALRFEQDRQLIVETFAKGQDPGVLTKVSFGSGDSHNGGRSVAICTFEQGLKVVYKPRSCDVDVAFASLIDHVNSLLSDDLQLYVPKTVDRGYWGWVEFIEAAPCADMEEMRCYHQRLGVLLAVVHMLQGNDFHMENVMAAGAHPVPIDLETVCVPDASLLDSGIVEDAAFKMVARSVLRTLMLPSVIGIKGMPVRDLGAVRIEVEKRGVTKIRQLRQVNTDFQRWVQVADPEESKRPESECWTESGETLATSDQQEAMEAGFSTAYGAILARRDDWSGAMSPIQRLATSWVRVLNRATNIYVRLIAQSCEMAYTSDGLERWLVLERFAISIEQDMNPAHRPTSHALVMAEIAAACDGDVAYFIARGDGRTYWTIDAESGAPIELSNTVMGQPAIEAAQQQVERMGQEDLALQMRLQGDAYLSAVQSVSKVFHNAGQDDSAAKEASTPRSDRPLQELIAASLEDMAALEIGTNGRANWVDFQMDPQMEIIRPSALDASLYSGRGGLAILFERAYRVLGDPRWLELASQCVALEVNQFQSKTGRESLVRSAPAGMSVRGGMLAGAWAVGRHDGHGDARRMAQALAVSVSDRAIQGDNMFDVIGGSAGYILLLLRLQQEEPIPGMTDTVGRLADHLVAHVCDIDEPGWIGSVAPMPLCGFGHGRAGIALALLEAGRFLDRSDLRQIGLDALAAEHRLRGETPELTWPDYRGFSPQEKDQALWGGSLWCQGSEGIALSRAAALQIVDAPFLEDDLAFALHTICDISRGSRGHLCCGTSGRIMAHQTLRHLGCDKGLLDISECHSVAAGLLDEATRRDEATLGVGLFQGMAGVAWLGLSLLDDDGSDLMLLSP